MADSYVVWRREPDGYVSASANYEPRGWIQPIDGVEVTFVGLGRFDNWEDALDCILKNRFAAVMGPFK